RTFNFFWETTNPDNGLTPDRWPTPSFSSVAAVGFALTAYPVGVEHGWVSRTDAAARTLTTLRFFWNAPQGPDASGMTGYKGFFYHFLDMQTGARFKDTELSSIDTALLMAGVLAAQQYFDGADSTETQIRALADSLYRRVQWDWMQPRAPLIAMAWKPAGGSYNGFIRADYTGYNEAMILYLLALGSPTHPVAPDAWSAFTSSYDWADYRGYSYVNFAPLFGYQYSHVWVDFRGIQDAYMRAKGIDYFENSRRATLAQQAYAVQNPNGWRGYGENFWGLTACDGPGGFQLTVNGRARTFHGYWARGAAAGDVRDDGTLAPTAAGGSVPFAPDAAVAALQAMQRFYGDKLFGRYGFRDAFNPTLSDAGAPIHAGTIVPGIGWFDTDYLGIDQGPILLMIDNHRSGLIWKLVRQNPYIVRGLCRAGFQGGWLEGRCG
ncbi:MAG TPA: glucoamylase family protein, partial [Longimicrobiales bacterium]|nr:glucoamylase family protein [Longimicrobiales bacterium]